MRRPLVSELVLLVSFTLVVALAVRAAAADAPAWTGWFRVADGRTFVTDGAMMLDAAVARVDPLPGRKLELSAEVVEGHLAGHGSEEMRVSELERGGDGRAYRAPSGVTVSARYVDYLRDHVPVASLRLRFDGDGKPITIVSNGETIGVVMPMARPRP
jgi:hypothetical protein